MTIAVDARGKPIAPAQADIDRLGARIGLIGHDFFTAYRTVGMAVLPASGDRTVYYAKVCAKTGWRCTYSWEVAPADGQPHSFPQFNEFSITAKSAAAFARAERSLWLPIGPKTGRDYVELKTLTVRSDTFEPVECNPAYPEPGCPDGGAHGARLRAQDAARLTGQPAAQAETRTPR